MAPVFNRVRALYLNNGSEGVASGHREVRDVSERQLIWQIYESAF